MNERQVAVQSSAPEALSQRLSASNARAPPSYHLPPHPHQVVPCGSAWMSGVTGSAGVHTPPSASPAECNRGRTPFKVKPETAFSEEGTCYRPLRRVGLLAC